MLHLNFDSVVVCSHTGCQNKGLLYAVDAFAPTPACILSFAPTVGKEKIVEVSQINKSLLELVTRCRRCMVAVRHSDPAMFFSPLMAVVKVVNDACNEAANSPVARRGREVEARPELVAARQVIAPVAQKVAVLERIKETGRKEDGRFVSKAAVASEEEQAKTELATAGAQALALIFNGNRPSNKDKKLARRNGDNSATV